MPAKLNYGFLCDGAMLVHGKWTYQGLFTVIHSVAFPAVHPEAVLAFQFEGPVGAHTLRVVMTDSSGKLVMPEMRKAIECLEFRENNFALTLRGMPLPAAGFYTFKVFLDAETEPFGVVEFRAELLKPSSGAGRKA
ncbi:MAG TPA: hypothetical protein VGK61_07445 [Planctomycetota bacterium]|jgi:hypothetical protein